MSTYDKRSQRGRFARISFIASKLCRLRCRPCGGARETSVCFSPALHSPGSVAKWGCSEREIDTGVLDLLRAYPWPGNARQLENAVERMVLLSGEAILRRTDVPDEILYAEEEEPKEESRDFKEARNLFERRFLYAVLHRHRAG